MQGHVDLDSSREELSGCSLEFALGRVGEGRLLEATGDRSPREMTSGHARFATFTVGDGARLQNPAYMVSLVLPYPFS